MKVPRIPKLPQIIYLLVGLITTTTIINWILSSAATTTTSTSDDHDASMDSEELDILPITNDPNHPTAHKRILYRPKNNASEFTSNQLLELCTSGASLTITKTWALEGTLEDITTDYLTTCHPFEVSINQEGRSMGHCADFVNYIKYAGARLVRDLPDAIYEAKAKACPKSTYLHGEYPINAFYYKKRKLRNVWLPNIEQIHSAQEWYFPETYMLLCKTKIACTALGKYLDDQEIQGVKLKYMRHSTPDTKKAVETLLNITIVDGLRHHPLERDYNKFFHSYGHSQRKHTRELVSCWKRHPFWPKLTVVGGLGERAFGTYPSIFNLWKAMYHNIDVLPFVSNDELRRLQYSHGVHICVSQQEGFGHYINEARALGSLVVTTNHPPMNEFVQDNVSGILANPEHVDNENYQIIGKYFKPRAWVTSGSICAAVKRAMEIDIKTRIVIGGIARKSYEHDTREMKVAMAEILKDAEEYLTK
ncbi:UNVERIFIED_CONTAM: hypothetical protein HDU68_010067 [Siphonaria sp. JEL0065]|nr:hypothetical protein HDU68_010067 [Siphonaria sp. JEL0065]